MTTPSRALIVIDVQQEYFAGPLTIQYPAPDASLAKITAAIDAAAASGIPIVVVQHTGGDEAPIFNPTADGFATHPEVASRQDATWHAIVKEYSSVFPGTGLLDWLREGQIDTITLVGYMTNNCILASAAEAETHGIGVEVLSDASGAISLANDAGVVDARVVHETLMALLHSNFAAVATTEAWVAAVADGVALTGGNLVESATGGASRLSARDSS